MCLILLAYRSHPDAEVILAGNRDEFHARPSAPPALIASHPRIYAGRDLQAGGTWMGRNEHGMVAALTNRRTDTLPPAPRSRGEIVQILLEQSAPEDGAAWLGGLDVARFRPFNVIFGSPHRFYAAASDAPTPRPLEPGLYALSNSHLNDTSWPKVARSLRFLERAQSLDGEALLRAMQAFLCDPTPPDGLPPAGPGDESHGALGAVFVGTPGYGTVSASIITVGGALGERYYHAEAAAMRAAQRGWAQDAVGDGGARNGPYVPPATGGPFLLVDFAA